MSFTFTHPTLGPVECSTIEEFQALSALVPAADAPAKLTPAPKGPKAVPLTKASREAFVAALPKAQAKRYAHASTKALAVLVARGTIKVPAGFTVGSGYAAFAQERKSDRIRSTKSGAFAVTQAR